MARNQEWHYRSDGKWWIWDGLSWRGPYERKDA